MAKKRYTSGPFEGLKKRHAQFEREVEEGRADRKRSEEKAELDSEFAASGKESRESLRGAAEAKARRQAKK